MKLLARIGAITSVCLLALLAAGATQALAAGETTMCKTNEEPCVAGNQYGAAEFKWKASTSKLVTAAGNINCNNGATMTLKTAAAAGAPLLGEIIAMAFEPCSWEGFTCAVTAINIAWKVEITNGTNPDGKMKIVPKAGEPRLAFSCNGGAFKCVYGAETTVEIHGGNPAEIVFKEQSLGLKIKEGTVNCPATIKWSANYVATMPTAVFVTKN